MTELPIETAVTLIAVLIPILIYAEKHLGSVEIDITEPETEQEKPWQWRGAYVQNAGKHWN